MRVSLGRGPAIKELFVIPRQLRCRATLLPLVAAACHQGGQRSLLAAHVAGCYQFAQLDGRPLRSASGFWMAPVRLDTTLVPVDSDNGYTVRAGYYSVTTLARIPATAAIDTAIFRTGWEILLLDTVLVTRSTGLAGQAIRLQPRARDFAGVAFWFNDVVDSTRQPQLDSVLAKRVSCPHDT